MRRYRVRKDAELATLILGLAAAAARAGELDLALQGAAAAAQLVARRPRGRAKQA